MWLEGRAVGSAASEGPEGLEGPPQKSCSSTSTFLKKLRIFPFAGLLLFFALDDGFAELGLKLSFDWVRGVIGLGAVVLEGIASWALIMRIF